MGTIKKTKQETQTDTSSKLGESVEQILEDSSLSSEPDFNLQISPDGISLLLDSPDPHQDLEGTVVQIEKSFREMQLPEFPASEILLKILENSCRPGESLISFPIMKGWGPTPSRDGRLEWERDFFSENSGPEKENETCNIWDQNDQQSVKQDELLARVHHPVFGEPGLDVFSQEIPVTKPTSAKLRSGKGVRQIDEGDWLAFYADQAGRIRYQDDTLVVDDVYIIKGDVSLETGNIRHSGTVHIEGDVKAGATIVADGDIMVKGMLDPCHVKCGGSLTVVGGIVGQEEFLIEVEGNLKAMYIGGAVIQCGGDVIVGNEIAHADIKANGRVLVLTGRIAGGEVLGREGIQIAEAGGSGTTSTLLIVGVDFMAEKRIAQREVRIAKLEKAQEKIQKMAGKVESEEGESSPEDPPQLCQLSAKSKLIGEAIIKEHAANRMDFQKSKKASHEEVIMLREVWSGTTIRIGDVKMVVRSSIEKPRVARLVKDKVSLLPLGEGNMPKSKD